MNQDNFVGMALEELYRVFEVLNSRYYANRLAYPMITIQKTKSKGNTGWFTLDKVWQNQRSDDKRYEINICAEYLSREVYEIVETMNHEMVHYDNTVKGIKDCNGQVHNKKFKNRAEEVGLIVEKDRKYGFGLTSCTPEFKTFIDTTIKPKIECFAYFRNSSMVEKPQVKEKVLFKYFCPICSNEVKGKRDKNIVCGDCHCKFEMEE